MSLQIFRKKQGAVSSQLARLTKSLLSAYLLVALLAPCICNELPFYLHYRGKHYFPAFDSGGYLLENADTIRYRNIDFRLFNDGRKWMAPIVYGPDQLDFTCNAGKSPLEKQFLPDSSGRMQDLPLGYRHWLGTTRTGRDVLATIVYGTRTALWVGTFSMILATLLGTGLGFLAGHFGNERFSLKLRSVVWGVMAIPLFIFQFLQLEVDEPSMSGLVALIISPLVLITFLRAGEKIFLPLRRQVVLPLDSLISAFTAGFTAIPQLLLVLSIMAVTGPSLIGLVMCIGLSSWPMITRATRTESLRIRQSDFIASAVATGSSPWRIAFRHYLPNMSETLGVLFLTGFSGSILLEAGLSFLGAGLPAGSASWGELMAEARSDIGAWWLVVFPGLALTGLTVSMSRLNKS